MSQYLRLLILGVLTLCIAISSQQLLTADDVGYYVQKYGEARTNGLNLGMYSPARMVLNRLSLQESMYGGFGMFDEFGMKSPSGSLVRGQDEYGVYSECSPSVPCFCTESRYWVDVTHVQTNVSSDGYSDGFGTSRTGFMIGYDMVKGSGTRVGLLFAYFAPYLWQNTDFWQNSDRVNVDDYHLGLYIARNYGGAEFSGYFGYAHQVYDTRRDFGEAGSDDQELYTGSTSGNSFFASVELAKSYCTASGYIVRPLAGLDYRMTTQQGYTERGSGDGYLALNYDNSTFDQVLFRLGVHFKKETDCLSSVLRLQYIYNFWGDAFPMSAARFAAMDGTPGADVFGVNLGRDYFNIGTGFNILLNGARTRRLGLDYDFNVSQRETSHAVSLFYSAAY